MFSKQNQRLDGSLLSGTPQGKHRPLAGYLFRVPCSFSAQYCRCACAGRQHDGGKLPTTGFKTHSSEHAKKKRRSSSGRRGFVWVTDKEHTVVEWGRAGLGMISSGFVDILALPVDCGLHLPSWFGGDTRESQKPTYRHF